MPETEDVDKYLQKMEEEDTKFSDELDKLESELNQAFQIDPNNLYKEFISTIGDMQRYNTRLARMRMKKNKARRFKEKIYAEKYEKLKFGESIALKSQHEYDTWISKDSNYTRMVSYCYTIDVIIMYLEQTVKNLSQKVYALQSMLKSKEYEQGPSY